MNRAIAIFVLGLNLILLQFIHLIYFVKYLIQRITNNGNHEPEINDRINRGRAAITKLNSIFWDRDVTPKTKTHIYHAIVKSTITYAAETWCLKAKR